MNSTLGSVVPLAIFFYFMKNSSLLTMAISTKPTHHCCAGWQWTGGRRAGFSKLPRFLLSTFFLPIFLDIWTFWTFFSGFGHCQEGLGQAWAGKPVEWSSLAQVWDLGFRRLFRKKKWTHNPFTSVGKVFKASPSRTFCRPRNSQDGLNSPHQFLLSSRWLVGRIRC